MAAVWFRFRTELRARWRAWLALGLGDTVRLGVAATLAHVLVTAIGRRRRELAILKALGFDRGQVRATVPWHATSFVAVALVVGVPLGAAAGRWVWRMFADNLGIAAEPGCR